MALNPNKNLKLYYSIKEVAETQTSEGRFTIRPASNVAHRGEPLALHIAAASQWQVPVRLYSYAGQLVYQQSFLHDGDFRVPADVAPGLYILQAVNGREKASAKLVVK